MNLKQLKFTEVIDGGDLMTIEEFDRAVKSICFTDDDGMGDYVKDGKHPKTSFMNNQIHWVYPSTWSYEKAKEAGITHIVWYNK